MPRRKVEIIVTRKRYASDIYSKPYQLDQCEFFYRISNHCIARVKRFNLQREAEFAGREIKYIIKKEKNRINKKTADVHNYYTYVTLNVVYVL